MAKTSPTPLGITQAEMDRFLLLESDRKEIGEQYDKAKAELLAKLQAGAPIQDGALVAELGESKRRFPEWKDAFIATAGQAAADALIAATEEKSIFTVDVHRRSRFAR